MKKLNGKQIGAAIIGAAIIGATLGFGFTYNPVTEVPVFIENKTVEIVNLTSIQTQDAFNLGVASVVIPEAEVIVKEKLVDNENLALVLDEIFDNDGSVEYLIEDLEDDELDQIVNRISFVNDIKALATAEAKEEFKDLINKEMLDLVKFDEDDVERIKVQDDADEVVVSDVDYEDKDADVYVDVKFEQDDVKYLATIKVEIKDGQVDDSDLETVVRA